MYISIHRFLYICIYAVCVYIYKSIYIDICMYMCLLIRFDYTFNSIYATIFIYKRFDYEKCIYIYDFRKYMYMNVKGFSLGCVKDDFHETRSKIHQFMQRTVCELNSPYCDLILITSS